jgi:hypothetical protein
MIQINVDGEETPTFARVDLLPGLGAMVGGQFTDEDLGRLEAFCWRGEYDGGAVSGGGRGLC